MNEDLYLSWAEGLEFREWDFLLDLGTSDFDMDKLMDDLQNTCLKPMDEWQSEEVLEFITNEISMNSIDTGNSHVERFQCISGYIFKNLTEENCKILSNSQSIGKVIFEAKEKYIRCHPTRDSFCDDSLSRTSENKEFYSAKSNKKPVKPKYKNFPNRNGKRSEKLWEFLLHLLCDTKTCPQLIKWENFEEGTFKFVQSNKVARLWGNRKKNENMTYEKFSRAMRYYYKSKVLLPVPGKRLVYKFGPRAEGWRNITPIS